MTKKHKKKLLKEVKEGAKRGLAGTLALYMFLTASMLLIPSTQAYALTGGASQPEVQSFEPIGTSDMVNLFSGDFTYNIPLLDVEGYPINLAYNSGVTMDQEASWTGLGWNVNVGTINRSMRGLPDDFKGDVITTETNIKKNWTVDITGKIGDFELFGKAPPEAISLNASVGVNYNNYNGIGFSLGLGLDASTKFGSEALTGTAGLGLNSSSAGGLDVSPSLSLSYKLKQKGDYQNKLGGNIGSAFNSRTGLSSLSIGVSLSSSAEFVRDAKRKKYKGADLKSNIGGSNGASGSFDIQQPTYTPSISNSMRSFSVTGRVKAAIALFGTDTGGSISVAYSEQTLKEEDKSKSTNSFGYLYSQYGVLGTSRHDFNRENEGSVSPATPNLAITNYTYDLYSVSGQGVGGSYRPYRSQVGFVFDNNATNNSSSTPITVELGASGLFHGGTELGTTVVRSKSGAWINDSYQFKGKNNVASSLNFFGNDATPDFENYVFREASEASVSTDQEYFDLMGGDEAVKIKLQDISDFNVITSPVLQTNSIFGKNIPLVRNYKKGRVKRNITIQDLTIGEVRDKGMGVQDYMANSKAQTSAAEHHLGQLVSLGNDGLRYVYGQPAYNLSQKEVTFAVGANLDGNGANQVFYDKGLVNYSGADNSTSNSKGLDNYFQRVSTPAYAHSYLLTSVLSDDYVDVDGIKGPSPGDLGSYTKFDYTDKYDKGNGVKEKINYKWRVPFEENKASYNEGLKSDPSDDKGSYLYGTKELFYLDKIETKNFIAVFHKSNREDGYGVDGENGGISSTDPMQKLDSIQLMTKTEYGNALASSAYEPIILKTVHFRYDYELCPNIPNNATGGGKLTLKKVFFTYRDSQKGKLSPYEFHYDGGNAPYNLKGYDRWGNYKPQLANDGTHDEIDLATFEYPYVDQYQSSADNYTSMWTMTSVDLPSGGNIQMEYESDDYAFVQNKKAMQMAKIVSVSNGINMNPASTSSNEVYSISDPTDKNRKIYFEKDPLIPTFLYVNGIEDIYFRCLTQYDEPVTGTSFPGRFDYVSGYAEIKSYGDVISDPTKGWIELKPVAFRDHDDGNTNPDKYNPIALAGIQFGQLHLSKYVWDSPNISNASMGAQVLGDLWQTFANFVEGFKNPNKAIFDKGRGTKIVMNKSWLRLNTPTLNKLGGGSRVKSVVINDSWDEMLENGVSNVDDFDYGQEYEYKNGNKHIIEGVTYYESSGVASYEPQLGGDENPFKQPIFFNNEKKMAPDIRFFQEGPLGESFFPSASVGYSKVTVRNLKHGIDANSNGIVENNERNVIRTATGSVVHEFYTAKDFPTLVDKTDIIPIRHKTDPFSLSGLFKVNSRDFYTGSQGFSIEINDMHGKPKSQYVYQEDQEDPITKVEYEYLSEQGPEFGTSKLVNDVQVVYKNGNIETNQIGVNFDMVADFRETTTKVSSIGTSINLDIMPIGPIPISVPMVWPKWSKEKTMFRSAVLTKVVQKFGVLSNTRATDLGSVVETRNLAYDAETGQVLLTETNTNYDDKVYSMNYPAYWHYDKMGPAYKNIGFTLKGVDVVAGQFTHSNANYFTEGDEIYLTNSSGTWKEWVTEINGNTVTLQNRAGNSPQLYNATIKIIRSGRRNMQSQMMASITTLTNPLDNFKANVYENVLQASAIEFDNKWRTYCDCNGSVTTASSNPYVLGTKGNYRPKVSYLHLSDRIQSDYNNNTNIREDGVFESYRPYYRLNASGEWVVDRKDWTYTAEVTEFNPYGQELANEDALGRESAAQFGFNQTLAKAVVANAGYRDIGFTSFEDDDFSECADNHFKFDQRASRISTDAHSGRYSTKVTAGNDVKLFREIADRCDMSGCTLDINVDEFNNVLDYISITATKDNMALNSNQVTWNTSVISGNPLFIPTNGIIWVNLIGTYTISVDIISEEGCQATKYIRVTNGVLQP